MGDWRDNYHRRIDIANGIAQHYARTAFLKLAPHAYAQMTVENLSTARLGAVACMGLALQVYLLFC